MYKTVTTIPDNLKDVMDQVTFTKARLYNLDKSNFALWVGLWGEIESSVSYYWLHSRYYKLFMLISVALVHSVCFHDKISLPYIWIYATDVSGLEPHWRHCVVSLSKTLNPLLSTGSTQEDPSQHDWKIVDWDVKNQSKQSNRSKSRGHVLCIQIDSSTQVNTIRPRRIICVVQVTRPTLNFYPYPKLYSPNSEVERE